mmetsp:Transcript_71272/g.231616  ORF Transcript_71272/g.231616 Transcript_71272/m.231616 type:complete len:880 (-) Transcript_71272:92-2731(-)
MRQTTGDAYALIDSCVPYTLAQPVGGKAPTQRTWKVGIKRLIGSIAFRTVGVACLILSLFAGGLAICMDLPDDPWNQIVDTLMVSVMVFFGVEIMFRCLSEFAYTLSFLFWMDIIGTLSMAFEISFLFGSAGKISTTNAGDSYAVLRTTNAVRCFARAGRLAKPLRCLSMFYTSGETGRRTSLHTADTIRTAKFLGERVARVLSTKVAMLTVVLVLGVPIFSLGRYPEEDFSLRMASRTIEADYARAYEQVANNSAHAGRRGDSTVLKSYIFEAAVQAVFSFYEDLDYFPYRLEGYRESVVVDRRHARIPGEASVPGREPNRKQSVIRQEVYRCLVVRPECEGENKAAIFFDFTSVRQYSAALDMIVICFLVVCMGLESWDLGRSVNHMVVTPLEKMLRTSHAMAAVLNQAIRRNKPDEELDRELDDDEDNGEELDETALLERVFKKMARLTSVFVELNVVDDAKLNSMDAESQGVLVEVMQYKGRREARLSSRKGTMPPYVSVVHVLPVEKEEIESWGMNFLKLQPSERLEVVSYIMFDSSVGKASGRTWVEVDIFNAFAAEVSQGYSDNPYHSFTHGCDVVGSCFRILQQVHWEEWLSDVDTVALLVSALCHDIGHPGKTNPFLVETSDDLALRYNDKSPLENMHCARLFEICTNNNLNVFRKFDRASYREARSVCIAGILYTDNAQHFDLVKEVRKVFETSVDVCDVDLKNFEDGFPTKYIQEVISKNTMLWIKVILHLADVSNPLKTFDMNKLWAMRVVDEFFAQGDEEKRLGIPIGMLNDRDKVNRSGAEHGFINFLLAPLVISVVRVFPMCHPLGTQMVNNMAQWHQTWIRESKPAEEDIQKRQADVDKVREQVSELVTRKPRSSNRDVGQPP